jgi:xylan 1,4-beta-xylosidase
MGAPDALSADQLTKLGALTRDAPQIDRRVTVGSGGEYTLEIPMRSNDVVLVVLASERETRATGF